MIRNLLDHPLNLAIVVLVIVVVVGWKRLPDVARSLGRSMRIFKSEVEEMKKDGNATPSAASTDTVKGDTFRTSNDTTDSITDPAARRPSEPVEREKDNQPPS